jgi:hypothetical protein
MATQRTSFAKLQRDRDKQAKAAAKRDRRQQRATETEAPDEVSAESLRGGEAELTAAELLSLVETVHRQYEAKEIDFETYEETKAALLARLSVD